MILQYSHFTIFTSTYRCKKCLYRFLISYVDLIPWIIRVKCLISWKSVSKNNSSFVYVTLGIYNSLIVFCALRNGCGRKTKINLTDSEIIPFFANSTTTLLDYIVMIIFFFKNTFCAYFSSLMQISNI